MCCVTTSVRGEQITGRFHVSLASVAENCPRSTIIDPQSDVFIPATWGRNSSLHRLYFTCNHRDLWCAPAAGRLLFLLFVVNIFPHDHQSGHLGGLTVCLLCSFKAVLKGVLGLTLLLAALLSEVTQSDLCERGTLCFSAWLTQPIQILFKLQRTDI